MILDDTRSTSGCILVRWTFMVVTSRERECLALACWTNAVRRLKISQMNAITIRRTVALVLFAMLLAGTVWAGLFVKELGSRNIDEWLHTFCLTQAVLLASCAVYGPGRFVARIPIAIAWGLAIGFALARLNLISMPGKASLLAGAILTITGTFASLSLFALHRWRSHASLAFGDVPPPSAASQSQQLSLQMLMVVTAAFAVTGVVARAAISSPTDPFGNEHDFLVMHAWLGFFPCLVAAPALLAVFRPSRNIVLAAGFFVLVALIEPLLFALVARFIFQDTNMVAVASNWETLPSVWLEAIVFNGQAVVAVVVYALLARAAGLRMLSPDQSKDKNPNPSGQPMTVAGCDQD